MSVPVITHTAKCALSKLYRQSHIPVVPIANKYCTGYPHKCLANNTNYKHNYHTELHYRHDQVQIASALFDANFVRRKKIIAVFPLTRPTLSQPADSAIFMVKIKK